MNRDIDEKRLEYIILYMFVGSAVIGIAALIRLCVLGLGLDNFTANVVFLIIIAIAFAVYFSIQLIIQNLMIPFIEKAVMKIPYFQSKKKPISNLLNMEEIRKCSINEKEKNFEAAIHYIQKTFASYVTDDETNRLCDYIGMYAKRLNIKDLKPIKINNQLTSLDIYHFGWNIWNHFRIGKQDDIACFLKSVFPNILRDVEAETIKKHLKDDERKGIIKIKENIAA